MELFLQEFKDSTDPIKSSNEISNALSVFRVKVNPELCRSASSSERIKFFISIFDQLLCCNEYDFSSVKISSFTASTSFLSKMIRSYPTEIQKAFSTFATKLVSPRKGSMLIVFLFSYIATFISGIYFDNFFHSCPLYHHIVNCESSIEDFSHIIQNFPNQMSLENYITILVSFIAQYQKTGNSKLLIPIQKIVEKCVLLDKSSNLAFDEVYKSKDITLIAFIFTTIEVNCDDFDFHELALNALRKIKTASFSERDDCLLLLSIKSKSFHVDCKLMTNEAENDTLRISIDEEFTDLKISEYSTLPYFYSLFLPNSLLLPDRDKDSHSILAAKFNTIARILSDQNKIIDVEDYIELFFKIIVSDCDPIQQYQRYKSQNGANESIQKINDKKVESNENDQNKQSIDQAECKESKDDKQIESNENDQTKQSNDQAESNESNNIDDKKVESTENNQTKQSNDQAESNENDQTKQSNDQAESIKDEANDHLNDFEGQNYKKKLQYDENVSSALKSFATSLPCLITNAKSHLLILILKRLFRTKIKSWMHGLDILKVIEAMKDKLFDYISLKDRIDLLLDFSMNPNEKLSYRAIKLIVEMTTKSYISYSSRFTLFSNFSQITTQVASSIDFFTPQSLIVKLRILAEIIKTNPKQNRNHLEWVASILSSMYNDYITDLYTLSEIFNFLQFFTNLNQTTTTTTTASLINRNINQSIIQMNEKLSEIAFSILIYSLYYMKGCDHLNKVSSEYSFYSNLVDKYLNSKSIDIVSDHPFDFKQNFPLISNAYSFYISQNRSDSSSSSRKKTLMFLIELFFEYFPSQSSTCLFNLDCIQQLSTTVTEFQSFSSTPISSTFYSTPSYSIVLNSSLLSTSSSVALNLVTYLYSKLVIVKNPHVFSMWMKNFPLNESLVEYAVYFLENSSHINGKILNAEDFDTFSFFLHGFDIKYESIVSSSLTKIDPSISADYILLAISHSDFMLKYNKEINMNSAAFREDFDKMEDKFKMNYIKKYVIFAKSEVTRKLYGKDDNSDENENYIEPPVNVVITKSLIDYGFEHLNGWEKMAFLLKCKEKLSKQKQPKVDFDFNDLPKKDRAFNTFFRMIQKDRIQNLIQFYIYNNKIDWIEHTLRLSVIKGQFLDFKDKELMAAISSSSAALITISKFIKKRSQVIKMNKNPSIKINIETPFNANLFIHYLYSKQTVRKREILQAYKLINLIDMESSIIFDFYRKFHSKHVKAVLALLTGFVSHVRSFQKKKSDQTVKIALDSKFVDFFFKCIKQDANEENINYASIAAFYITTTFINIKKISKEDNNNSNDDENENGDVISEESMLSLRYLFGLAGFNSVELSTLFSTMIAVIFSKNAIRSKSAEEVEIESEMRPIKKINSNNSKNANSNVGLDEDSNATKKTDEEENLPQQSSILENRDEQKSLVAVGNLNDVITRFINGDSPSQIQAAVRIISRSISSMRDQSIEIIEPVFEILINRTIEFCTPTAASTSSSSSSSPNSGSPFSIVSTPSNLSLSVDSSSEFIDIIFRFSRCGNCPFLALNVAKLLRTILQSRAFTKLYQIIASHSLKLCEASFEFTNNLIGILIKRLHQSENLFSVFCKIALSQFESKSTVSIQNQGKNKNNRDHSINNNYLSLADLFFFIECFSGRLKKIQDNQKRENVLLNYVYSFIQNFKSYDNWDLYEIYLAWADFIEKNMDSDNTDHVFEVIFKVLTEQFVPNAPRFFPVFAVFAKKSLKFISDDSIDQSELDKRKAIVEKAIENAISLVQNDAHIYALKKLKEGNNLREALDIALLEMMDF